MSRGIPPVRWWRVKFYKGGQLIGLTHVQTINKRFARWLARDKLRAAGVSVWEADKATASVVKPHQVPE